MATCHLPGLSGRSLWTASFDSGLCTWWTDFWSCCYILWWNEEGLWNSLIRIKNLTVYVLTWWLMFSVGLSVSGGLVTGGDFSAPSFPEAAALIKAAIFRRVSSCCWRSSLRWCSTWHHTCQSLRQRLKSLLRSLSTACWQRLGGKTDVT